MGNVGSSVFGTWPIVSTEGQDISASAAMILLILTILVLSQVPQHYGNAMLNCVSTPLIIIWNIIKAGTCCNTSFCKASIDIFLFIKAGGGILFFPFCFSSFLTEPFWYQIAKINKYLFLPARIKMHLKQQLWVCKNVHWKTGFWNIFFCFHH